MIFHAETTNHRKLLFAIILAATMLRFGTVLLFHPQLLSDDRDYDAIARSLASGEGYKIDGKLTAYRVPGYPLILAGTYALFGDTKAPIRIFQALSDVVSCLLLFAIGKKLFSEKVGLIAAAGLALYPVQILYVSHLMTETLFTTLFLLIIFLAIKEKDESNWLRNNLILGALIGVSALFRPTILLFPILIFLWRWRDRVPLRTNVGALVATGLAAVLALSPWLVRNYVEFQRVSVTSNAGVNFWMGSHQNASGAYSFPQKDNPLIDVKDDFERSDLGFRRGFEFVTTSPINYGIVVAKKFVRFFSVDYWLMMTMQYKPEWASAPNSATIFAQLSPVVLFILHFPYMIVLFLGTFGMICNATGDEKKFLILRSLSLYWLFAHLIFFADARFRFPIMPVVILAGAYGWSVIHAQNFQRTKLRIAAFTILCFIFIFGWVGEYVTIRSKMIPARVEVEDLDSRNTLIILRSMPS
jgi:4-amino-4-deoxy-L-arabinose transferase-like glycosyltransferase